MAVLIHESCTSGVLISISLKKLGLNSETKLIALEATSRGVKACCSKT
jgi:hypothetical protein